MVDYDKDSLKLKELQLKSLLEVTEGINQNYSAEHLFEIYRLVLHDQLKVGKIALFLLNREWKCELLYGVDLACKGIEIDKELLHVREMQAVQSTTPSTCINAFEYIIPVYHKDQPLAYALIGDFNSIDSDVQKNILPFIQTITNVITVAIENKKLAREYLRQAEMQKELELAAEMQTMLFPEKYECNFEDTQVATTYLPHHEVGGDFYDFMWLNNNETVVCMADVSGKGISAALLMSNFQAILHALISHHVHLPDFVKELNAKVYESAKGEKYITFFIGVFIKDKKEIHYVNAGHNPPFLYLYSDKKVHLLQDGTVGLGMFEELPFVNQGIISVEGGCSLFCYTDGVVEVENNKGEAFGIEKLQSFFVEHINEPLPQEAHKKLLDHLIFYKEDEPFIDDVTFLTVQAPLKRPKK